MRNLLWKNITIEARKPGQITCARDWITENVTLLTPSNHPIQFDRVENVQLPLRYNIASPATEEPADPGVSGHVLGH